MNDDLSADEKRLRLRYDGTCRVCATDLPARTEAVYERSTKTVRCVSHVSLIEPESIVATIDNGTPGASARREFERHRASRERRGVTYPRIGGFLRAISNEPQSTTAWNTDAFGEERLGKTLNELASDRLRVLHDRRVLGSRANIDHLAVTPLRTSSGVKYTEWVIF